MPTYKLIDYNFTTAAELARAILEYVGVAYEDERHEKAKAGDAEKDTPFGTLPVLQVDGRVIAQHQSICRYLAKQHENKVQSSRVVATETMDDLDKEDHGDDVTQSFSRSSMAAMITMEDDLDRLVGKDEIEFALCDLVMDGLWHMFAKIRRAQIHQLSKDEKLAIMKTMITEDVPPYLNGFEKMLKDRKSESDYLVGKEVTWCDIGLTLALAALKYRHGLNLESHPQLVAYMAKMMEVPQLAEFLAKRAQEETVY